MDHLSDGGRHGYSLGLPRCRHELGKHQEDVAEANAPLVGRVVAVHASAVVLDGLKVKGVKRS